MKPTLFIALMMGVLATGCGTGSDTASTPPAPAAGTAKAGTPGSMNASGMTPGPGTANFGAKAK